jgi:hypothetical protein
MATKTTDPTAVFADAFIAGVKQTQELAFSGLTAWVDLAGKPFAMPDLESVPFLDSMSSPKDLIERSFAFAEELLATEKDFALKLVSAMAPAKKTA